MSARGAAAALLLALAAGGCATLEGGTSARFEDPSAPQAGSSAPAASPTAPALQVEIEAPDALKALLERHLDIVRLGRLAGEEVEDSEWRRLVDAVPAQSRELLQTEGYFAPRVTVHHQPPAAAGEPRRVQLRVEPGQRARVSRVTLDASGELERAAAEGDTYARDVLARWRAAWKLPVGSEFRIAAWNEAKNAALTRLRAAGFASATWSGTAAAVDPEGDEVRLFLVADSGPLYRFDRLEVEGLLTHDAETLQHLADARRGAPLTEQLMLDFQERLIKSRLFESVTVHLEPNPEQAAQAAVQVRLREAPQQTYTVGVGVSANDGLRASLQHVYRRVFGYAAMADNKFEWAQKRRVWQGEISTHPGEHLYRNLLGGEVEWLESDTDEVLAQRLRLGRTRDMRSIEQLYFAEAERSKRTTALEVTSTVAYSLNYHGLWRHVDSVLLPTEGFTFAGQGGIGRSNGSASAAGWFTRAYGRFIGYLPLGSSWYGQGRLEVGRVFVGPGVLAPESQRWRAGGDESVRGYDYRSLGPVTNGIVGSGNALATGSVELARPISANLPSVWGAVFVDAGQAADDFAEMKPALGYGVGVRWRSPVGPLRIDLAYGHELRSWRLHFSVGIVY